jgi:hypothetical protein
MEHPHPQRGRLQSPDLLGFKVFRLDRSLGSQDCPDCPEISKWWRKSISIISHGADRGREGFVGGSTVAGNRYTYFVVSYNSYKFPSPESNG